MAERTNPLGDAGAQILRFARELTNRQKAMLAGGTVLVLITLLVFVRLMSSPDMKLLVSGMQSQDAQALAAKLSSRNISYALSPDSTSISVPADQLDQARLEIASEGTPRSGRMGFEIFDKPNWAGSDFSEKVNYQRALEAELERTIQTLRSVEAVRVHLVLPQDSVFLDREGLAKASVVLRLRGAPLDATTQAAITNLVAGAVERLRPENVSVVDAESNRPLNDVSPQEASAQGKYEVQLAAQLAGTLEAVAGKDRVRVTVHVERDPSSGEETQETYDPNSTVALSMQRSEERNGSSGAGGIPGTASNVPNAAGPGLVKSISDDSMQSSKTESGTYAVNRLVRHTVLPAGRIRKLSAAILVDDTIETKVDSGKASEIRRKRSPEELKQIEDLARASLGIDSARGDSLSIQNLSFQSEHPEAPRPPSATQRVQVAIREWSIVFRYAAIFLLFLTVYAVLLRPIKKQVLASFRELSHRSRSKLPLAAENAAAIHGTIEGEAAPAESVRIKRQALEKVKAEPAATSRLLQSWIRGSEAQ